VGVKGWFNFLAFVFDILWSHVKKCWFNFGHFAGLTFFRISVFTEKNASCWLSPKNEASLRTPVASFLEVEAAGLTHSCDMWSQELALFAAAAAAAQQQLGAGACEFHLACRL